jgi:hypothetical protein
MDINDQQEVGLMNEKRISPCSFSDCKYYREYEDGLKMDPILLVCLLFCNRLVGKDLLLSMRGDEK